MILLAEAPNLLPPSASRNDIVRSIEAARLTGWEIFEMPPLDCENAENALWYVPHQSAPKPAVWLGYIPDFTRYEAIYQAAKAKNLFLPNTPQQHRIVQEFDMAYPHLEGLTPLSETISSLEDVTQAGERIGYPIFVKGAVQSRKSRGWKACVADNEAELKRLSAHLFEWENRSRGRVVLREVVKLRHTRSAGDFPMGREFRLFLLHSEILACGYYWEGNDPLQNLSDTEKQTIESLALTAAKRLSTPYVAIDIGQLESGKWTIIETGDPQFSGLSQISPLAFWHRLKILLSTEDENYPYS